MSLLFYLQPEGGDRGKCYRKILSTGIISETRHTKDTLRQMILLHGQPFCEGSVNKAYVRRVITKNTMIYVLLDLENKLKGFLLAHPLEGNEIYLDVICAAKGFGKILLTEFFDSVKSKESVVLSALTNVLAYYPQFGFEHRMDCVGGPQTRMPSAMIDGLKKGDEEWKAKIPIFLQQLRDTGFVVDSRPECQDPTYPMFLESGCDGSGFEMRKCIKSGHKTTVETRRRYRERQTRERQMAKLNVTKKFSKKE